LSEVLKTIPHKDKVATGVDNAPEVAKGLATALADTYRLLFKTHAYHWNVEGPLFFPIHKLSEMQYENLFAAADELAERIRALGLLTPASLSEITKLSVVKDKDSLPSAQVMVEDLAADHEAIAKRMREVISMADEDNDPVTADLLTGRCAFHEKAAWMLRATAK
jgi:starvation-inducible DNA-binding protein